VVIGGAVDENDSWLVLIGCFGRLVACGDVTAMAGYGQFHILI
jgi:hypothetical protein